MTTDPRDAPAAAARPDLSNAELDALLQNNAAAPAGAAQPYDLFASDKILRSRMPALDRVNERWVPDFQRELGERIRQPVEAAAQPAVLSTFAEWQAGTTEPASFNVFAIKPWQKNALVAVDGNLLFVLVDRLYGGGVRKAAPATRHRLTPAELRFNKIVVDLAIEHFRKAFAPIAALDFQPVQTELDAARVCVATGNEALVVAKIDVTAGDAGGGTLSLLIPLAAFDPVRDRLAEGLQTVSADTRQRWRHGLRAQLEHTQVTLSTVFLETDITLRELLQLKAGDIFPIEMPKTATLFAGSHALLRGKFGRSRGYNAVAVTEAVKSAASTT
jgi:flagellar motor switch protein FliM